MTTTKETNHAKENAICGYESIKEMVRALDRDTAAEDYVNGLPDDKVRDMIADNEIDADPGETMDELRDRITDAIKDETIEPDGFEFDEDRAREMIQEDALEVCVRSGWVANKEAMEPEEFYILLCTGGPALRIRGELDRGEPSRCWLEYQDWGTPWTQLFPSELGEYESMTETLLTYSRQFYFGE